MGRPNYRDIDKIFHSPIRLAVASFLLPLEEAEFNRIKKETGATDGNLSTHLTKMEACGYIAVKKEFLGKKPVSYYSLTDQGRKALKDYIDTLKSFLSF